MKITHVISGFTLHAFGYVVQAPAHALLTMQLSSE